MSTVLTGGHWKTSVYADYILCQLSVDAWNKKIYAQNYGQKNNWLFLSSNNDSHAIAGHAPQNFSHAPKQNSGCRIDYPDSLLTGGVEELFLLDIGIASPGAM